MQSKSSIRYNVSVLKMKSIGKEKNREFCYYQYKALKLYSYLRALSINTLAAQHLETINARSL